MEDNVRPEKNKESFFQLPAMNHRRCLEAQYSGTPSLPLLTNCTPIACSIVKHKDVIVDCGTENATTLDPHTNTTTPSDVPSMTIVPYSSPSPSSWCSLPSVDASPTHSRSGDATPSIRSGDTTTTNPRSCDASPTHNHSQKEHCKLGNYNKYYIALATL